MKVLKIFPNGLVPIHCIDVSTMNRYPFNNKLFIDMNVAMAVQEPRVADKVRRRQNSAWIWNNVSQLPVRWDFFMSDSFSSCKCFNSFLK